MPFVSGFITAASFYFDVGAAYFVPDRLGTILAGFPTMPPFDNPFLLAHILRLRISECVLSPPF